MIRSHDDYHLIRVQQEIDRARFATTTCARRAHLELARLHKERLRFAVGPVALNRFEL